MAELHNGTSGEMALHFSRPLISADIPDSVCHTVGKKSMQGYGEPQQQAGSEILLQPWPAECAGRRENKRRSCRLFLRASKTKEDFLTYAQLAFN